MEAVRIGCSGFSYDSWKGPFYPEELSRSRWLEHYAGEFETVEVNATFYRLQKRSTFEGWVEKTPDGFSFAIKASRYLTHIRRLEDTGQGLDRFWEPLEPLRDAGRLGPVLWQLPEQFHRDDDALAHLLDNLPDAVHCFEFRNPSWFDPAVLDLLREAGSTLVLADDRRRPLPGFKPLPGPLYIRFHYGTRGRGGNYSPAEIEHWAHRIAAWRREHEVFAYFNNDWNAYAPANARYLRARLS
jgi:uncharacterized protein YecE (DUF72 family)